MSALDKARALLAIEMARVELIKAIRKAQADKLVSESQLMELLNINQYSLTKFLEV